MAPPIPERCATTMITSCGHSSGSTSSCHWSSELDPHWRSESPQFRCAIDISHILRFSRATQDRPTRVGSPCRSPEGIAHKYQSFGAAALTTTLPLLLAGPTAAAVLAHIPAVGHHRTALGIMAFGVALQGMGVSVSSLYQSSVIARLHNDGFPHPRERPSLFLMSIPASLSALAATALAQQALRHFPTPSTAPAGSPELVVGGVALYYVGVTLSLVFWGLALWWFVIAASACIGGLNEVRAGGEIMDGFTVVFAHGQFPVISFRAIRAGLT